MADLIDRQAAIELLSYYPIKEPDSTDIIPCVLETVRIVLTRLPAVDAVEVVRCKDCVYFENEECACPYMFMSDGAHYYPDPNDFCSYGVKRPGERREEDG